VPLRRGGAAAAGGWRCAWRLTRARPWTAAALQAVHPSGKWILGPKNLAFMYGPDHKALRKSFLSLFTTKALGVYVSVQVRFACAAPQPLHQRPAPPHAAVPRCLPRHARAQRNQLRRFSARRPGRLIALSRLSARTPCAPV
jgi:hypothetical protein